jgi:hypothetical protein
MVRHGYVSGMSDTAVPSGADEEAFEAARELIYRAGAEQVQVGVVTGDSDSTTWWAHAQLEGVRIAEEGHPGPVAAMEALARRLITGGICTSCGELVVMAGSDSEEPRTGGLCHWSRHGTRWRAGCLCQPGKRQPPRPDLPPGCTTVRRPPRRRHRRRRQRRG